MRQVLFISFLFCSQFAHSQFGLSVKTQVNSYDKWDLITSDSELYPEVDIFKTSTEISLDYWLRLKNLRIEFFPELAYQLSKSSGPIQMPGDISYGLKALGAGIHTRIYLLDLVGDCDCPTFSKQNPFFKKGFFVNLGVKEYYQQKKINTYEVSYTDSDFTLQISGGIGIDIGINDLITITPFGNVVYYPSTTWDGINANHGIIHILPPDESTSNLAFQVGIRIGFRPDYLNNR